MKIGYARVSTDEQDLDLQISAVSAAGCDAVFHDHGVPGAESARAGLDAALQQATEGDTSVVWRLDGLGGSRGKLVERFNAQGAQFQSPTETISTMFSCGTFIFHVMGALAQSERSLIGVSDR